MSKKSKLTLNDRSRLLEILPSLRTINTYMTLSIEDRIFLDEKTGICALDFMEKQVPSNPKEDAYKLRRSDVDLEDLEDSYDLEEELFDLE